MIASQSKFPDNLNPGLLFCFFAESRGQYWFVKQYEDITLLRLVNKNIGAVYIYSVVHFAYFMLFTWRNRRFIQQFLP
ncbi:hypothetical protein HA49_12380 [Tatumella morbirosei]|uniref:Uncharacterized protein n=1 Tax=Tatumella morbirosei TaxID=642227 RepID=A0A095T8F7_9GAMM|nr:hypothetical protein HA49_12380 [Tatumella morbirosei]